MLCSFIFSVLQIEWWEQPARYVPGDALAQATDERLEGKYLLCCRSKGWIALACIELEVSEVGTQFFPRPSLLTKQLVLSSLCVNVATITTLECPLDRLPIKLIFWLKVSQDLKCFTFQGESNMCRHFFG